MRLRFIAYCGMSYDVLERATLEQCLAKVKSWINRHELNDGGEVIEMVEGREWELTTADDAGMISDLEGRLKILEEVIDDCE